MFANTSDSWPSINNSLAKHARNVTDRDCPHGDSTTEEAVKVVAYFAILLVSFVGNILLVLVICKNKQLRKSINYFVFSMAVSDLFTPLTIMPIKIVEIISGSHSWKVDSPQILGNILCKLCYFLPDVSLVVSIQSILLISMDRFIAVVLPFSAKLISSKVRLTSILCTWIIAVVVHAPYFYAFRLITFKNKSYCKLSWTPAFDHKETSERYFTAIFITFVIVPICLLALAYGSIAWTLKKQFKKRKQQLSCHQRQRDRQFRKIIRLSAAIMMAFIFCMIPQLVFLFTQVFLWNWEVPPICIFRNGNAIHFSATFMMYSWSAINPCICFVFNKNYSDSLKHVLFFGGFSRKKFDLKDNQLKEQKWHRFTVPEAVKLRRIQPDLKTEDHILHTGWIHTHFLKDAATPYYEHLCANIKFKLSFSNSSFEPWCRSTVWFDCWWEDSQFLERTILGCLDSRALLKYNITEESVLLVCLIQ